jgi:hypothetical protein
MTSRRKTGGQRKEEVTGEVMHLLEPEFVLAQSICTVTRDTLKT